jgi:TetR/AcrR family transcriptional regulator, repressor for uid operon
MSFGMSATSAAVGRRTADAERRERILEGAERAFVRHGFHATTMQHVADEIGMSAGNLYRYFPSKEAIVEGLCAVDQEARARAFTELMADKGDIMEAMCAALRRHVLDKPPEKARLIVEIWTEAGRNPRVAALSRQIDADVLHGVEKLMDAAKAAGVASPRLDSRFGARFFFTFVAGLFKRIAVEPDFDPEAEAPVAIGVLKALFKGALSPEAVALMEED